MTNYLMTYGTYDILANHVFKNRTYQKSCTLQHQAESFAAVRIPSLYKSTDHYGSQGF